LSAQSNSQGVPKELLEAKKLELIQEKVGRVAHLLCLTHSPWSRLKPRRLLKIHENGEKRNSVGNARSTISEIESVVNVAVEAGEEIHGEVDVGTEILIEEVVGDLIDALNGIQDHHLVDEILEIGIHSMHRIEILMSQVIVEAREEMIEGGHHHQSRVLQLLLDLNQNLALHPQDDVVRPPDLVPQLPAAEDRPKDAATRTVGGVADEVGAQIVDHGADPSPPLTALDHVLLDLQREGSLHQYPHHLLRHLGLADLVVTQVLFLGRLPDLSRSHDHLVVHLAEGSLEADRET
jgi:hypothetical protein